MDGSVAQSRVEGGPIEGRTVQLKTVAKGKKTYLIFFSPESFLNFTVITKLEKFYLILKHYYYKNTSTFSFISRILGSDVN